jgi:hypothetical protein
MKKAIILLVLLVFFASLAESAPFKRMSTMVDIPEAYGLRHFEGKAGLGLSLYPLREEGNSYEMDSNFCIGLLNWGMIGVSSYDENNIVGHLQFGLPLKSEMNGFPALPVVSVGIQNISSKENLVGEGPSKDHDNNSIYLVASKDLSYLWHNVPLEIHLGIGNGRFRGEDEDMKKLNGIFMGIRYSPSERVNLMVEEDGNDVNAAVNFNLSERISLGLAWVQIEEMFRDHEGMIKEDSFEWFKGGFSVKYRFGPFGINAEEEAVLRKIREQQEQTEAIKKRLEEIKKRRQKTEEELERLKEKTKSEENTEKEGNGE